MKNKSPRGTSPECSAGDCGVDGIFICKCIRSFTFSDIWPRQICQGGSLNVNQLYFFLVKINLFYRNLLSIYWIRTTSKCRKLNTHTHHCGTLAGPEMEQLYILPPDAPRLKNSG